MRRRAVVAVAVAALAVPAVAQAHPRLLSSTPSADVVLSGGSPPPFVSVRFSEDAEPVGAGITVTGPDGRDVATGPIEHRGRILQRPIDAHERGTYVVEWLAVGSDTHPARGAFLFSVGGSTRATAPGAGQLGLALQAIGRWLSLLGYALGFGVPFAAAAALGGAMTARLWRLVAVGIGLMIVAEPVSLLGQTATLSPAHPFAGRLAGDVLLTSYGHVAGLRLGAALALWALIAAIKQAGPRALWAIPAVGALVAIVHADAAHRIAGLPTAVSFAVVTTHVAAAGAWLGCVVAAVMVGERRRLAPYATGAALLAIATGVALAIGHVRSVHELLNTGYGLAVSTKLAVVTLAVALAAVAKHRAELAVGLAVLAAAAVLVSLLPPV
jgi:copper transport protein